MNWLSTVLILVAGGVFGAALFFLLLYVKGRKKSHMYVFVLLLSVSVALYVSTSLALTTGQ